jgi:HAT1-interacting factor 1
VSKALTSAPRTKPTIIRETTKPVIAVEESVERAKRAFALKKYEEAVEHYATALEAA